MYTEFKIPKKDISNLKINFQIDFSRENGELYFDTINKLYYLKTKNAKEFNYLSFNEKGRLHNEQRAALVGLDHEIWFLHGKINRNDGYAVKSLDDNCFYNNGHYLSANRFAKITNHLVCSICKEFCKQQCF